MRRLVIKLLLFVGVMEALPHVDFMVLLSGMGLAIAIMICCDLLVDAASVSGKS